MRSPGSHLLVLLLHFLALVLALVPLQTIQAISNGPELWPIMASMTCCCSRSVNRGPDADNKDLDVYLRTGPTITTKSGVKDKCFTNPIFLLNSEVFSLER